MLQINEKLHPQGDGVLGHGAWGMGHGKDLPMPGLPNAQCPKSAGGLSSTDTWGWSFPPTSNENCCHGVLMQKANFFDLIIPYCRGFTLVLVLGLCSCGALKPLGLNSDNFRFGSNVTPIREIKPKPENQDTVYIQGKVEKQVPLMNKWAYQINDSTGKIWVVTNQNNVGQGKQIVIKGKVRYQSIPLSGKEFGEVYVEEEY